MKLSNGQCTFFYVEKYIQNIKKIKENKLFLFLSATYVWVLNKIEAFGEEFHYFRGIIHTNPYMFSQKTHLTIATSSGQNT